MKFEPKYDYVLWERDFSEAVAALYGRPYRLQQLDMRGNDTYIEFDVTPEHYEAQTFVDAEMAISAWQTEWAARKDSDDRFKEMHAEREDFIDMELLVINMYERGELPVGRYLMKVWW